jgi:hypothetical protein
MFIVRIHGHDSTQTAENVSPFFAQCALSAKSVVPEFILFDRRVSVDSHRAGGGRN